MSFLFKKKKAKERKRITDNTRYESYIVKNTCSLVWRWVRIWICRKNNHWIGRWGRETRSILRQYTDDDNNDPMRRVLRHWLSWGGDLVAVSSTSTFESEILPGLVLFGTRPALREPLYQCRSCLYVILSDHTQFLIQKFGDSKSLSGDAHTCRVIRPYKTNPSTWTAFPTSIIE